MKTHELLFTSKVGEITMKPRIGVRRISAVGFCVALTFFALFAARIGAAAETFKVAGRVLGASGKNAVYVTLWQADGFLTKPVREIKIEPGAEPVFHFEVIKGRWAVSAYEDRNSNGKLDMWWFGPPKEPSGFWRPFNGHHKPRFEEVASPVDKDILDADITLK
jgi:uncharacterized protein (DUF2141 family)